MGMKKKSKNNVKKVKGEVTEATGAIIGSDELKEAGKTEQKDAARAQTKESLSDAVASLKEAVKPNP